MLEVQVERECLGHAEDKILLIHINGAEGEGGGQILRSALTLSLLSKRPIRISNIRANRPNPGLAPQHLTGLLAAAEIGQAKVEGGKLKSQEVVFEPGETTQSGAFSFDVSKQSRGGSAGSVSLILQTILIPLLLSHAPSQLKLLGGTHVLGSPMYEYLNGVFLETLRSIGATVEISLKSWGFYPAGGGEISVDVMPLPKSGLGRLRSINLLTAGDLVSVEGWAIASNLPAHIAQRMTNRARKLLLRAGLRTDIQPSRVRSRGPGAGMILISRYRNGPAGFSVLGRKGMPSESVAELAVEELIRHHESLLPVDPHLADQLMLPLLLADGTSTYRTSRITSHQRTQAELINLFYPQSVAIQTLEDGGAEIVIDPIEALYGA